MVLASLPDQSWVDGVVDPAGAGAHNELGELELVPWDVHAPHPRADEIEVVVPPYLDGGVRLICSPTCLACRSCSC